VAVAGPDLDNEFGEDEFVDEFGDDGPGDEPWHHSTSKVVGASAAALAVIAVLVGAVTLVAGGSEPSAPQTDFVDPSFSSTAASAPSSTTTTETITSTPPVSTTEINGPSGSSTTSGSSGTTTTPTSGSESSISPPLTRPSQRENDESPGQPSRKPRFNVTRTLAPQQAG
jgi:hypothetical protein